MKLILLENCWKCDGSGTNYLDDPKNGVCKRCDGTGKVPTEDGEAVLELLEHQRQRGYAHSQDKP